MWAYEQDASQQGYKCIAGVDEAGRGPLAGPVVSAAVILPESFSCPGITDSKKLSEKKRRLFYRIILEQAHCAAVGFASHKEIDQINILAASLMSMKRAVQNLGRSPLINQFQSKLKTDSIFPDFLLIDGKFTIDMAVDQEAVVKGDAKSISIAAASIVAKVTRDTLMVSLHQQYPAYGFDRHKGYPTKAHKSAILKNGPCPVHRKTFKGVKEVLDDH